MKILFLSDDFPPQSFGGAGISTYELAEGMHKAGHAVYVITTCRKESGAGESSYKGLTVFKIASNYDGRWRWYVSLYNRPVVAKVKDLLNNIQPDVVHINNIHHYLSYHCFKIAKQGGAVVVFTARDVMAFNFAKLATKRYRDHFDYHTTWYDHLTQAGKRYNPLRNFMIRWYLTYANKLFAVSDALREALKENGIQNVTVTHTGIDVSRYVVSPDETAQFKEKYGLGDKKVLLFAGRLSDVKGGRKIIEAMPKIAREVPDAVLVIAGTNDQYAEQMKAEAVRLGFGSNVIVTGWIEPENMKVAYAAADVVLVPSLCFDSFPRVVLEAMAVGRPVIGTRYGGAPEIIVDGVTGYVVDPFNVELMAEKITDLLSHPMKAQQFGEAGYQRVVKDFNMTDKVEEYISAYKQLLLEKSRVIK